MKMQKDERLKKYTRDVKREIMMHLILRLRRFETNLQNAQYLSQAILAIFPVENTKELFKKLSKLSQYHKEVRKAFIKYANQYFEEEKKEALKVIPPFIKKGELSEAVKILKAVNYYV